MRISSHHNPTIKRVRRLRERKHRQQQQLTLVDGYRETRRAVEAGILPKQLFLDESRIADDDPLVAECRAAGSEIIRVPAELFSKLAFGDRHDGWLCVVRPPTWEMERLELPPTPCIAVLEQVEKPGNLGAILRSADGADVSAILIADPATDLGNPNVIRASLGAVFRLPCCIATAPDILAWVRQHGLRIVATRVDAEPLYYDVDLTGGVAIVLGSEAEGLSDTWRQDDIQGVRLPMHGIGDSLNVSATAAVLFYEAVRQRARR